MKYWFVLLMIAISLMGCSTTKKETVTVVKNIYVGVPNELMERCAVTPPPVAYEYETLSAALKEYALSIYVTSILRDIAICDQQIANIQEWNKEQSNIFNNQSKPIEVENVSESQPNESD